MPSTRRSFLASSTAAAASALLAGCASLSPGAATPDDPPPAGDVSLGERDRHVYGATGDWSSFGANAANNRQVADGRAPVDGVTEQWRAPFPQLSHNEPVVVDGTVYVATGDRLRALDAETGDERWSADGADAPPLVLDGVVYAARSRTLRALDGDSGEVVWSREFDGPGRVTSPSTYGGDQLVCGVGERVLSLDPASGDEAWTHEVFGQVRHHPAFLSGYWDVVATDAGRVYLLDRDGVGGWQWQLPARPVAPPAADAESVYVNCEDGETYALKDDSDDPEMGRRWSADTGWADGGVAVVDGLALVATGGTLEGVDTGSGSTAWSEATGDWRHTAPTAARDTVFVGGDALYAFDATPGGDPAGGPALRFEHSFAGRVGPGPVLDDGTLYTVAEVEEGETALVALA